MQSPELSLMLPRERRQWPHPGQQYTCKQPPVFWEYKPAWGEQGMNPATRAVSVCFISVLAPAQQASDHDWVMAPKD
jgi:hypothetical protein